MSYITSAKKKDEDKLMFTVTRGFDLLLSRYLEVVCPAYHRKERRPAVVLCHSVLRSQYVAQLVVYAQCGGLYRRGGVPSVGVRVRDAEILKKEAALGTIRTMCWRIMRKYSRNR